MACQTVGAKSMRGKVLIKEPASRTCQLAEVLVGRKAVPLPHQQHRLLLQQWTRTAGPAPAEEVRCCPPATAGSS